MASDCRAARCAELVLGLPIPAIAIQVVDIALDGSTAPINLAADPGEIRWQLLSVPGGEILLDDAVANYIPHLGVYSFSFPDLTAVVEAGLLYDIRFVFTGTPDYVMAGTFRTKFTTAGQCQDIRPVAGEFCGLSVVRAYLSELPAYVTGGALFNETAINGFYLNRSPDQLEESPQPPLALAAFVQNQDIRLTWQPHVLSDTTRLYRATSETGPWALIDESAVPNGGFLDNTVLLDVIYYYYATSVKGGTESSPSEIVNAIVDSGIYTTYAADYDATQKWTRGATPDGLADSPFGFVSFWFNRDAPFSPLSSARHLLSNTSGRFQISFQPGTQRLQIVGRNTSGTTVVLRTANYVFTEDHLWHHVMIEFNTNTGEIYFFVDGVNVGIYVSGGGSVDNTGQLVDYTTGDFAVGGLPPAGGGSNTHIIGCLSELVVHNGVLGLPSQSVIDMFRTAGGKPKYIGNNGEVPFGVSPFIYMPYGRENAGSGGTFLLSGVLPDCNTSPSD